MSHVLTRGGVPPLLDGLTVATKGETELPIKVCAEHLALLGATWEPESPSSERDNIDPPMVGELALRPKAGSVGASPVNDGLDCVIQWQSAIEREPKPLGDEAIVQAVSGLMEVHGRDSHIPRRLGLEVASVAAGIVAAQGVLAALIARDRGQRIQGVQTSVLQSALLFLYHHLAIATCNDEFPFRSPESGLGPPFCTADGHWVELEVLTGEAWTAFWKQLGVEPVKLPGAAWLPFVYRYLTGRCALPAALHEATERYTLAEVRCAADACGVSICRVRNYQELLTELQSSDGIDLEPGLGTPWTICPGTRRLGSSPSRHSFARAPLTGLRVVESTTRLQGPLAGHLLRMLGANVVKVEPPGGDVGRLSPPLAGSLGAAYRAYNTSKQVVEIDYQKPEGQAEIENLVAQADVFLHNWRPGRAEKLGLDYEDLARRNPGLIYAHASGWGRTKEAGPTPIAGDFLVQAYTGCSDGLTPSNEPPFPSRVTLVDVTGGLLACEGILAGLYLRERAGVGCRVDTSLFAGAMMLQTHILKEIVTEQETSKHLGRPLWSPLDRPIETADGFLAVTVKSEQDRRRLSEVCGLGTSTEEGTLEELVAERLRSRSAMEWERLLLKADIPAAVVCSDLSELPHDPRVVDLLEKVDHACWVPAAPWQFKT